MMIQKYPASVQDFGELRNDGYCYVDKTQYAWNLAEYGKYYFLSRPRRFGKSLFVSTLECLFDARKKLFEGTYIYDKWDWDQRYPIIRISFSNIDHKIKGLAQAIHDRLDSLAESHKIALSETTYASKFNELIHLLYQKHQQRVVVLIDEYDKPIIDHLDKEESEIEQAMANQETMKIFYSILKDADPYLKLVFITGVSKFARVSIFSDLNNLTDLSLDDNFAAICGISQQELADNFKEELKVFDVDKIREWYNGYTWDLKTYVYNPFSLLHFFRQGKFQNFWFSTGTPTFLTKLAKKERLYDVENIRCTPNQLEAYQLDNLESLPLLFQTGYLTFKKFDERRRIYTLGYPNREVRQSFLEYLVNAYVPNTKEKPVILASKIEESLLALNLDSLKSIINSLFKSIPYQLWQKENEHFYHAILHLTFNLMGVYTESEVNSADGRMDALVRLDEGIFCFEFKLDKSADEALAQIESKGYLEPYKNDGRRLFGIGVNFSTEQKAIEALLWREY